jgi:hypothetical protein
MIIMKVKEKAESFAQLWLHVNAGDEGMQVRCSAEGAWFLFERHTVFYRLLSFRFNVIGSE